MAFGMAVLLAQVDALLSASNDELSQYRRELQIKAAVELYSTDRPNIIAGDIAGDDGKYYLLSGASSVISTFDDRRSRILSIEYPAEAITADEWPVYLLPNDWLYPYEDGSSRYIFFPNHTPATGETVRIRFTVPYAWTVVSTASGNTTYGAHGFSADDWIYLDGIDWLAAAGEEVATAQVVTVVDTDTFTYKTLEVDIPAEDFFAVTALAASLCCQAIATKYSRSSDSIITADSVDHLSRAREFAARAREYRAQYETQLNIGKQAEEKGGPAGVVIDVPSSPEYPHGRQYLFHDRRSRRFWP